MPMYNHSAHGLSLNIPDYQLIATQEIYFQSSATWMPIYNHSAIGLPLKWSDYQWITTHPLSSIPVQLECQVLPLSHWITTKITRFPTDIHSTSQLQSCHRRWVMPIHFNYLPLHCHLSSSMLPLEEWGFFKQEAIQLSIGSHLTANLLLFAA